MRITGVVFGTTSVVILGSIFLAYQAGQRVNRVRAAEERREHAIVAIDDLLSTMQDAETGQRGFIITGDESYLGPFHSAEQRLPATLERLLDLNDIDVSSAELSALDAAAKHKLAELRRTIELRRTSGFDASLATIQSGVGKATMDQIRSLVQQIRTGQETRLASERRADADATRQRTATFIFAGTISLVVLGWGYLRIRRAIAERNVAIAEEQRERELLSTILTSIGDCVIVTDTEGRITFMNPIAATVTGWTQHEAMGRPLTDVFHIISEESRQPVDNPVDKVIRSGVIVGLANHTLLIRKDGGELPIDDSGAPVRLPGGKLEGVVLVFRDFSEARRAQLELMEAKEAAENASRAKDTFLAMLSHELRTPLTPVLTTLQAWELVSGVPDQFRNDIYMLRRNVELEIRLIDDLLDLTRISRGVLSFQPEPTDVHGIIHLLLAIISDDIKSKQIDLEVSLDAKRSLVNTDPSRLQQVLWNVVRNAVSYTDPKGRISISTANDGDSLKIVIADSGVGMSPDTLERLFTPFEQADRIRSLQYGGLGLGLAISRALLEQMGGTIEATSEGLGRGSRFVVSLQALTAGAASHSSPSVLRGGVPRQRILVVEDHVDTALALARLLKLRGHEVRTAGSASDAERELAGHNFDLLICDIGLPDRSGYDLIQTVRSHSNIPAIAATGFGMQGDREQATAAGFDAHLTKPIDLQKLEASMAEILRKG